MFVISDQLKDTLVDQIVKELIGQGMVSQLIKNSVDFKICT